jgi:hypothetical protein
MSGALVFQCRDQQGRRYALRRWPSGTRRDRIEQIRAVVSAAHRAGCEFLPSPLGDPPAQPPLAIAPETTLPASPSGLPSLITDQSLHWELSPWMPGDPLPIDATPKQIHRGAQAIARFHRAVRSMGVISQPPPAAAARVRRVKELDRLLPAALDRGAIASDNREMIAAVDQACWLLRHKWNEVSREITRSLSRYERVCVETQYVLRDVHRLHVLFEHHKVTGMIDFDAIRIDTPMTDLARWLGSFPAEEPIREAVLAGYYEDSPSSDVQARRIEEELMGELGWASPWISLANWVAWVALEDWSWPGGTGHVAARITELIRFARWEK